MTQQQTHQLVHLKDYSPPDYLINQVDLIFNLHPTTTRVESTLVVQANHEKVTRSIPLILHGENLKLISIELDGNTVSYQVTPSTLIIAQVPERFTLHIVTEINPQANTELSGLYQTRHNFCTQCEAEGFRRITYFLDRPDVMARYTTTIYADKNQYPILLSNGNRVAGGDSEDEKHWVRYEDPFKKPSYLFALVAGDFDLLQDQFITRSQRKISLQLYVEKGYLNQCSYAMAAIKKAMQWDEKTFGREYDLDCYMVVAVSDFNMGAMENKGLNIFNTKYILANPQTATDMDFIHVDSVVAHEYFHNWTGNRITCRDWFQLSLKEGLTIFREHCFDEDNTSKVVSRIQQVRQLRTVQFAEDASPLAHPVQPQSYIEINNFYTTTIYEKGSELIRMMRTLAGDAAFYRGIALYFERYDGKAVTIEELIRSIEETANLNLQQFRLWYTQAGTPQLNITDHYDPNHQTYTLTVSQHCQSTPGEANKKPFHIPIKLGLIDASGVSLCDEQLLELQEAKQSFTFSSIATKPIPSLLRGFSAPVHVHYEYSDADLISLFRFDSDAFNRWNAGQQYWTRFILRSLTDYQQGIPLQLPQPMVDALKHLLETEQGDKYLLTELITVPSERLIAEQMPVIDVEGIYQVREWLQTELAIQLKPLWLSLYNENHDLSKPYQFNISELAKRSLKNYCLHYLGRLPEQSHVAAQQFEQALSHNMTDTLAALSVLTHLDTKAATNALEQFYAKWQHDPLVVNKWFSIQAQSRKLTTLSTVKHLLKHPAFSLKNPNNVYALIGTFSYNQARFHDKKGAGYQLITEIVLKLNQLNPQIAARILKPLTNWQRYDEERRTLMKQALITINQAGSLSKDVYELVTKSLTYSDPIATTGEKSL